MTGRGRALTAVREQARVLRAQGLGYQAIADAFGVVVSTAWRWTCDVQMTTLDENDGRHRPLSAETLAKRSASAHSQRLGTGIWSATALKLLHSRREHADVAREIGVAPSTVRYHRVHRLGMARTIWVRS